MRYKQYEYKGQRHTAAEWDHIRGFRRGTVSIRIRNGWSVRRAISQPINGKHPVKRITIDGESHTLKQWAKIKGVSYRTIVSRIATLGWSKRRAICTPTGMTVGNNQFDKVALNGETHSLKEWGKRMHVTGATIARRIKNGMSIEDAITAKPFELDRHQHRVSALGQIHSLRDWMRITGIPDNVICRRLSQGWSPTDAVTIPVPKKKVIMITVNGETMNASAWERRMGYPKGCILQRIAHGWAPETAVTVDPAEYKSRTRRKAFATLGIVS